MSSITHHPDVSTLMTCSAGSQPEALCAVVASHLSMCSSCMEELGQMEQIGVSLFERLPAAQVANWSAVFQDLPQSETRKQTDAPDLDGADVPTPLICVLGPRLDDLSWELAAEGIWQCVVPLTPGAKGDLRLIKLAPGKYLPRHGHKGEELTILLRGGYTDDLGTFKRGDFSDLDDDVEHELKADATDGCILLIASENRPQFVDALASAQSH
ncbi:MAG: cupin domain-containing protein [Pseudomonadota bacterium]